MKPKKQNPRSAIFNLSAAAGSIVERKDEKKTRKKYRERAAEMLKLAKEARTEDARASYLHLAASWDVLANGGHGLRN